MSVMCGHCVIFCVVFVAIDCVLTLSMTVSLAAQFRPVRGSVCIRYTTIDVFDSLHMCGFDSLAPDEEGNRIAVCKNINSCMISLTKISMLLFVILRNRRGNHSDQHGFVHQTQ